MLHFPSADFVKSAIEAIKLALDAFKTIREGLWRTKDEEKHFENVIEPMFEELRAIHSDYLRMLRDVLTYVEKDASFNAAAIKSLLTERREAFSPIRTMVRELSHSAASSEGLRNDARSFHRAVGEYLSGYSPNTLVVAKAPYEPLPMLPTPPTNMSGMIDLLDYMTVFDRATITKLLVSSIKDLEYRWKIICQDYAQAKIRPVIQETPEDLPIIQETPEDLFDVLSRAPESTETSVALRRLAGGPQARKTKDKG